MIAGVFLHELFGDVSHVLPLIISPASITQVAGYQ
jgi:hypothetical protein